jgi:hypothetical protein
MGVFSYRGGKVDDAAVEVLYNGERLIPSPLVEMTVEAQFDDNGSRTQDKTLITLTGSVVILPSGSYEQLYTEQEALRTMFSVDEKDFVIRAGAANCTLGSGVPICSGLTPKVTSVTVEADIHVSRFDYRVDLEDLTTAAGASGAVDNLTNQWSFTEDQDTCTLQVEHTVSAEGADGRTDKFEQALAAVKPLLGITNLPIQLPCFAQPNASGMFDITHPSNGAGGVIYEVSVNRRETADVSRGTYAVTESFTIVSGVPFYFTAQNESFEEDNNGVGTVTVAGTVQGLGRTITKDTARGGMGFERAASGFLNVIKPGLPTQATEVYNRYKLPHGSGLNLGQPTSYSVSENRCRGTVDFSITYTDDIAANLPSGISNKTCSSNITEGIRVIATHAIPFRRFGNLQQDIRTTSEGSISLTCDAQAISTGNPLEDTNRAIEAVQDELNRLRGIHARAADYITLRITGVNQDVDDRGLSCSATVAYAFTVDLAAVQNATTAISLRTL